MIKHSVSVYLRCKVLAVLNENYGDLVICTLDFSIQKKAIFENDTH